MMRLLFFLLGLGCGTAEPEMLSDGRRQVGRARRGQALMRAATVGIHGSILEESPLSQQPQFKVLVLTTDDDFGRKHIEELQSNISGAFKFEAVCGLDFSKFGDSDQMMNAPGFAIPEDQKKAWSAFSEVQGSPAHNPSGELACILGHRHLWQRASEEADTWTVILEDDARPTGISLAGVLADVPAEANLVFLEPMHCRGITPGGWSVKSYSAGFTAQSQSSDQYFTEAYSTAAYALRQSAAAHLLTVPLNNYGDYVMNLALYGGKMTACCPKDVPFTANYKHESHIHRGSPAYIEDISR